MMVPVITDNGSLEPDVLLAATGFISLLMPYYTKQGHTICEACDKKLH